MIDLTAAIASVLASADDDVKKAEAVLNRLRHDDVLNDLHEAIHDALCSARAAYIARDDLYENPSNSRVAAEIATTAIARLLIRSDRDATAVDLDTAQRVASTVEYRDWRFRAVPIADGGVGIEVEARNPDTHHSERVFPTTRLTEVTSSVEEACFRAALLVEYHEAQERFRVAGKAVFDPHSADNVTAPTNIRS